MKDKGLTNEKEVAQYNKDIETLLKTANQLSSKFSQIKLTGLKESIAEAKEEVTRLQKQLNSTIETTKNLVKAQVAKTGKGYKDNLIQAIDEQDVKKRQEYEQKIVETLKEQTKAAKEKMDTAQQDLDTAKEKLQILKDQKKTEEDSDYGKKNASLSSFGMNRMSFRKGKNQFISGNDFNAIDQKFIEIVSSTDKASTAVKNFNKYLEESGYHKTDLAAIDEAINKIYIDANEKATKLKDNIKSAEAEVRTAGQAFTGRGGAKSAYEKALNTEKSTTDFLQSSEYNSQLNAITQTQGELAAATNVTTAAENELKNTTEILVNDTRALNNSIDMTTQQQNRNIDATNKAAVAQRNYDNEFERIKYHVKYLLSITNAWRQVRSIVTQTFNDVSKLDKAFAEIAMVTNYSVADMWSQYSQYAEMANKLGQTTESVIQASGLYYQQGLDTAEALKLTEDTMKLATLAGLDFKDATSQMTAALRAFHMEMDEGSHVTDVYAEVAANAAVDVQGLSDAMSATAAIAHSSGMAFETTTAMLATMVEATQEAPKNLGTAMKAVLARFSELKKNVDESGEDLESIDYNKVDKALKSVGINIKDANGQFRDMDDVLLELGAKWDSLSRNAQRYIATIAAGSRQQSRFIALMENHERTMELIEVATDSTGRANEQFAKYADTVEYKVNKIKNSWEELRVTLMNKGTFNWFLDMADSALQKMKTMDIKDFGVLTVWALTVGKTLVTGILEGLSTSGNKIRGKIASIITGQKYDVELQAKIDSSWSKYYEIRKGRTSLEQQRNRLNDQAGLAREELQRTSRDWQTYFPNTKGYQSIEQINSLYKERVNIYNELIAESLKEEISEEKIKEINERLVENARAYDSEVSKMNPAVQELANKRVKQLDTERNITLEAEKTRQKYEQQTQEMNQQQKYRWAKLGQSFGTAAGQAATTAISMALTGSFSATEVATATMTTSIIGAVSAATQMNWQLMIAQAAIAAAAYGLKKWAEHVEKTREKQRLANDEVYKYKKQLEDLEKTQEKYNQKLDEANSKYKETKEKWDDINSATKTYKELTEKSILDEEESQQLIETTQTLAELIPELVIGYDDQANAILDTSENYDKLIEQYQKAEQNARALQKQAEATAEALGLVQNYIEGQQTVAMAKERANLAKEADQKIWKDTSYRFAFTSGVIDHTNPMVEASRKKAENMDLSYVLSQKKFANGLVGDPEEWLRLVWSDTSENASAWQQLVIDTLQETTGAKNTQSLTLNSKADEIISAFDDNDAVWQEFTKKFQENLANSEEAVEKLEKDAEAKKAELKSKIPALRSSIIEGIIADLSKQGVADANLAQYKDLLNYNLTNDQLEQFIDDAIDAGAATNGEVISKGIENYMETFSINPRDLEKLKSFNEEQLEIISNFLTELPNLPMSEAIEKYNELIANEDLDLDTQGALDDLYLSKVEQIKSGLQQSVNRASKLLKSDDISYSEIYDAFNQIGETETKAILDAITDKTKDKEVRAALTDSAIALIENGIDPQAISTAINAIDWSSVTIFSEEDMLKILEGSLAGFDLSDEIIKGIYKTLATPLLENKTSTVDYSAMVSEAIEKYDTFTKKGTELTQYFEDNKTAIALEGKELKQVQKALEETGVSADAFLDTTNGGTIFNVQAAREWYEAQTNNSKRLEQELEKLRNSEEASTDEGKEKIEDLEEQLTILRQEESVVRSILGLEKSIDQLLSQRTGQISNSISAYKTMMSNVISKGSFDSSSFSSWVKSMIDMDSSIDLNQFFNGDMSFNRQAYSNYIDQQITELENLKNLNTAQRENLIKLHEQRWSLDEVNNELDEQALADNEIVKAQKEVEEAHKKVESALNDIAKAEQNVIDKQNELNEAMYGSNNFKNQLDSMYNYSTLNQKYADAAARAKDILDNPNTDENTKTALQDYLQNNRRQLLNYLAQNKIYGAAAQRDLSGLYEGLPSRLQDLNEKFGANYDTNIRQYFKIIDGVLTADIQALNQAAFPDDIKNEIATLVESYNTNSNNILKNNDSIRKLLKERQEIHKANLQAEVSIQEKVAEVLKEKYEQQVEDLKDKYDAMKKADDDYLDALQDSINKQRKLREQENKWEDLAQKRKKLSLQQRDTSSANLLSNQKLEKDIQKDEQSLLDSSIDSVIDNLKELYEMQEETRQDEIEYQEALKDNTNWIAEANKIVLGLGTAEDFINWMKDNSEDWKDKTAQQIELEKMELTEMFQKHQEYMEEQEQQIIESLNVTEQEVQRVVADTSETLIAESERSLNEITEKVDSSIESAKTALTDAMTALSEKQTAYLTALEEEDQKAKELGIAYNSVAEGIDKIRRYLSALGKVGIESYDAGDSTLDGEIFGAEHRKIDSSDYISQHEQEKGLSTLREQVINVIDTWIGSEIQKKGYFPADQDNIVRIPDEIYKISKSEVIENFKDRGYHGYYTDKFLCISGNKNAIDQAADRSGGRYNKFEAGGLVNYTGPAWVDGTPTHPEAFLSADDTENIAAMTNILSSLKDLFDFSTYSQSPTINNTNKNDTTINVTVNVDSIANDYDVDSAIERIKQDIVDAASYSGSNVILNI